MKISELKGIFPEIDAGEINVNPISALEQYLFGLREVKDYRNAAIDLCLKKGITVTSTLNNDYDMARRFVRLVCPSCGAIMPCVTASFGGNGHTATMSYKCTKDGCGGSGSITFESFNGVSVSITK